MGKYNLGSSITDVNRVINKDDLYINDSKARAIEKDILKQLDIIRVSLMKSNEILNKTINKKIIKGSRVDVFKGWAKKSKAQSMASEKLKCFLKDSYEMDLRNYPIKLLDERIAELEKKISNLAD